MNVHNDKLCPSDDNLQYENKTLPQSNTENPIDTANPCAENPETVTVTDTSENAAESTDSAYYSHIQDADVENSCVCRQCGKDCHTENISAQEDTFTPQNQPAQENHSSQDTKLSDDAFTRERLGKLIAEIIDSYIEKMATNPPPKTISGNSSPFVPATPRKPRSIEEASLFASQLIRRSKNQGN